MAWIWNVMLSFSNEELWDDDEDEPRETCEPLDQINSWVPDGRLVSLTGPTYKDDAGHGMDAILFGGGFKHFDIEGFVAVVEAQNWKDRANVQLWVKGGEEGMCDDPFTLVKIRRRKPARPKPEPAPPKPKSRSRKPRDGGRAG